MSGTEPATPGAEPAALRTRFGVAVTLLGIVVVLVYLVPAALRGGVESPAAVLSLAFASLAAWGGTVVVPPRWVRVQRILLLAAVVAGAGAAWGTNGLLIIPVIACIVRLAGRDERPALGYAAAIAAGSLIAIGAVWVAAADAERVTVPSVLALEAGVLIALLGGINRRQQLARAAEHREAEARAAAAREEQERARSLATRQGLARDMHDVLAHSLGGLIVQLDAAEAQLEAGQSEAALVRLRDARALAASGLAEARRAVDALRSDPVPVAEAPPADVAADLADLVRAHERLGGPIEYEQLGEPRALPAPAATALRRALQESLSNARKHAPGAPVTVRMTWGTRRTELLVRNPLPVRPREMRSGAILAASGSGRGLSGMRERFEDLPGGAVSSGERDGAFEVRAAVREHRSAAGGLHTRGDEEGR